VEEVLAGAREIEHDNIVQMAEIEAAGSRVGGYEHRFGAVQGRLVLGCPELGRDSTV
jgi:hypothetical protein